jgi:hypothetical protein
MFLVYKCKIINNLTKKINKNHSLNKMISMEKMVKREGKVIPGLSVGKCI